jgi:hypothetical protein
VRRGLGREFDDLELVDSTRSCRLRLATIAASAGPVGFEKENLEHAL